MSRYVVSGLAVVLLVITAGCFGGGSVPSVPAAGGDGADDAGGTDAPAGGTSGGVELVENRTAALQDAGSYTTEWRMQGVEDGNVVGGMVYTTKVDVAAERSSFGMEVIQDGEVDTSMETYHADGVTYQRMGDEGEVSYASSAGEFTPNALFDREAYVYGGGLDEFTFAGTQTYDGVRVERYVMEKQASWLEAQQQADEDLEWTEFTYEVLVDEQGLVRSESWRGEGVDDDGVTKVIEFSYTLTGVGSTHVAEPAWIDDARAAGN